MSQLGFLGFEILFCAVGWRDLNWNAFDNVDTGRFQCIEFRSTGEPVLWTQRRRDLLLAPPTFRLRFDVLQPLA